MRGRLWRGVFYLLSIASLLGTLAHGFVLTAGVNSGIWYVMYFVLALVVAMFVLATTLDVMGEKYARRVLPAVLVIAAGFYMCAVVNPESFLPFILYEVVAMLLAFAGYTWLMLKHTLPGAGWIAAGIVTTILAAAVQATGATSFTFIWSFDHNGVYHLIQMPGLVWIVMGLKQSVCPNQPGSDYRRLKHERS